LGKHVNNSSENNNLFFLNKLLSEELIYFAILFLFTILPPKPITIPELFFIGIINRSLNSSNFQNHTGYLPKDWPQMIKEMKETYSNF
jgi:hypothetical protein